MNQEIIVIDGVRYYADRPNSCRGCFFWKNRKAGCSLKKENCYYLVESPKKNWPCKHSRREGPSGCVLRLAMKKTDARPRTGDFYECV